MTAGLAPRLMQPGDAGAVVMQESSDELGNFFVHFCNVSKKKG